MKPECDICFKPHRCSRSVWLMQTTQTAAPGGQMWAEKQGAHCQHPDLHREAEELRRAIVTAQLLCVCERFWESLRVLEYLHLTGCGFCCFFLGIFQSAPLCFATSPCRLPQPSAHSHLFGRYPSVFLQMQDRINQNQLPGFSFFSFPKMNGLKVPSQFHFWLTYSNCMFHITLHFIIMKEQGNQNSFTFKWHQEHWICGMSKNGWGNKTTILSGLQCHLYKHLGLTQTQ